jgi:hypothetical protein
MRQRRACGAKLAGTGASIDKGSSGQHAKARGSGVCRPAEVSNLIKCQARLTRGVGAVREGCVGRFAGQRDVPQ